MDNQFDDSKLSNNKTMILPPPSFFSTSPTQAIKADPTTINTGINEGSKPPKPTIRSITDLTSRSLTTKNLSQHNNALSANSYGNASSSSDSSKPKKMNYLSKSLDTGASGATPTSASLPPLIIPVASATTTQGSTKDNKLETKSVSSQGSNKSFISNASSRIINLFRGGKKISSGSGQLSTSLDSFHKKHNFPTDGSAVSDSLGNGSPLPHFRSSGRGIGIQIRKEVGEALGIPNFVFHPYVNDISEISISLKRLNPYFGSPHTSIDFGTKSIGELESASSEIDTNNKTMSIINAQLTFESIMKRVKRTSIYNNKSLSTDLLSYIKYFHNPAINFNQHDYVNPVANQPITEENIPKPGSWSYYYDRSDPLCMSSENLRKRRKWLLHPRFLQRLLPPREDYAGLQNAMLFSPRSPRSRTSSTVSGDVKLKNNSINNNSITNSTYSNSFKNSYKHGIPRGGLPLPELYSSLSLGSNGVSDDIESPMSEFDIITDVTFRGVVQRKTSKGLFTEVRLSIFI